MNFRFTEFSALSWVSSFSMFCYLVLQKELELHLNHVQHKTLVTYYIYSQYCECHSDFSSVTDILFSQDCKFLAKPNFNYRLGSIDDILSSLQLLQFYTPHTVQDGPLSRAGEDVGL